MPLFFSVNKKGAAFAGPFLIFQNGSTKIQQSSSLTKYRLSKAMFGYGSSIDDFYFQYVQVLSGTIGVACWGFVQGVECFVSVVEVTKDSILSI